MQRNGEVSLQVPQTNRTIELKPGQSVDIGSGIVEEPFARNVTAPKPETKPPATASAAGKPEPAKPLAPGEQAAARGTPEKRLLEIPPASALERMRRPPRKESAVHRIAARSLPQCPAQRGQIVLGLLVILGLAFGMAFYTFVGPKGSTVERDKITAAALAQARDALIGRAVSDNNRPGALPCPDTNNDGTAEGLSGNECPSYIGRLPWKTLGLPDLRDGNGELLWYAFSRNFRDDSTAQPINTDTKGSLTVYSNTTGTTLTSQAAAVIFAPGAALGTQDRSSSTTMSCTAPSGTISRDRCAANYLETASSTNNAVAAGPYIQAPATNTFNDRLLVITTDDLMTPVERRAAKEIISLLQTYYTTNGYYPWA